jgi:gamma-glutamylcyclotransferase (GGCT)/AIG2-like uncharacterized protein YtfP
MNLFAYGTLIDTEIMAQVSGATHRFQQATLNNYVRKTVRGEVYPAITRQKRGSVNGVVYFNVSPEAFHRLDKFEGSLYIRTDVEAICDNGERVDTYTYVISEKYSHQLSAEDWNYENFEEKDKHLFLEGYKGYDELK